MRMSANDIKTHKKMAYYVSTNMPAVQDVKVIIDAILDLAADGQGAGAGATRQQVVDALQWGQGPMIKIVPNLQCAGAPAYGCYRGNPDEIEIELETVENFEKRRKHRRRLKNGKYVFVLGVKLLHELTHWVDDLDGQDNPAEEGEEFEKRIYGDVVHAPA